MDNDKCYFFFSGYYAVAAASDILRRNNITNRIIRAPVRMRNNCGFALVTDLSDAEMSSYLLEMKKIIITKKEIVKATQ